MAPGLPVLRSGVSSPRACARRPDRAREVAAKLDLPCAYEDWRAMVADPRVDAVAVAVPPVSQPEIVIAAAEASGLVGERILAHELFGLQRAPQRGWNLGVHHLRVAPGFARALSAGDHADHRRMAQRKT